MGHDEATNTGDFISIMRIFVGIFVGVFVGILNYQYDLRVCKRGINIINTPTPGDFFEGKMMRFIIGFCREMCEASSSFFPVILQGIIPKTFQAFSFGKRLEDGWWLRVTIDHQATNNPLIDVGHMIQNPRNLYNSYWYPINIPLISHWYPINILLNPINISLNPIDILLISHWYPINIPWISHEYPMNIPLNPINIPLNPINISLISMMILLQWHIHRARPQLHRLKPRTVQLLPRRAKAAKALGGRRQTKRTTLLYPYKTKNWSTWLPSGYVKIAIEHTPFIVDWCWFTSSKMVIFESFLYVYQAG